MEFEWDPSYKHQYLFSRPTNINPASWSTSQHLHTTSNNNPLQQTTTSIPLPLITIGYLHAPIPPGTFSMYPEGIESFHLGIDKFLSAVQGNVIEDDSESYMKLLSITDPFSAASLSQAVKVNEKKVLFVEKSAAEGLARGRMQLVAITPPHDDTAGSGNFFSLLQKMNPFFWIGRLRRSYQHDACARDEIRREAAALHRSTTTTPNTSKSSTVSLEHRYQLKPTPSSPPLIHHKGSRDPLHSSDDLDDIMSSVLSSGMPSSSTSSPWSALQHLPAHLANISVRLALSLLHNAPNEFSIIGGMVSEALDHENRNVRVMGSATSSSIGAERKRFFEIKACRDNTTGGRFHQYTGNKNPYEQLLSSLFSQPGSKTDHLSRRTKDERKSKKKDKSKFQQGSGMYAYASSMDALQVHYIPGFDIIQGGGGYMDHSQDKGESPRSDSTMQASKDEHRCHRIAYTPVFLSQAALHSFAQRVLAFIGGAILAQRHLERKEFRIKLQHAASIVAGTKNIAANSPFYPGGSGRGVLSRDDSDEEGFEEPPEIQELMQELAGISVNDDDGSGGGGGLGGGTSRNPLIRTAATITCGLIAVLGPTVESLGGLMDSLILFVPGGSRFLGIPLSITAETILLQELLQDAQHNNIKNALQHLPVKDLSMQGSTIASTSSGGSANARDVQKGAAQNDVGYAGLPTTHDTPGTTSAAVATASASPEIVSEYAKDITIKTIWMGIAIKLCADEMDRVNSASSIFAQGLKILRDLRSALPSSNVVDSKSATTTSSTVLPGNGPSGQGTTTTESSSSTHVNGEKGSTATPLFGGKDPLNPHAMISSFLSSFGSFHSSPVLPQGSDPEDQRSSTIALLRYYLPLLEYNAFSEYFPKADGIRGRSGDAPATQEEVTAAQVMDPHAHNSLQVQVRFDFEENETICKKKTREKRNSTGVGLDDRGKGGNNAARVAEDVSSERGAASCAKGILLIGDLEAVLRNPGRSFGGIGMAISVEEGGRYLK